MGVQPDGEGELGTECNHSEADKRKKRQLIQNSAKGRNWFNSIIFICHRSDWTVCFMDRKHLWLRCLAPAGSAESVVSGGIRGVRARRWQDYHISHWWSIQLLSEGGVSCRLFISVNSMLWGSRTKLVFSQLSVCWITFKPFWDHVQMHFNGFNQQPKGIKMS